MPTTPARWPYATRLNGFKTGAESYWPGKNRISAADLVMRAASVPGLSAVDLNYPDHLAETSAGEFHTLLADHGLGLNGFAMRYYSDPAFKLGAFTHPDDGVRRKAIDLTRRGLDALAEAGGDLMTLWMGQDGFDYPFEADYARLWDREIAALAEVCAHNPAIDISVEYKPNEPRAFALLPDVATTLLAVTEVGASNIGVTLDFAHVLYADEMPAYAAMLIARKSRLLGVHLNDGYGKRDDGLIAGSIHPAQTVELLLALKRIGYAKAIYFDTFPDVAGLDPVAECATNIAATEALIRAADRLADDPALIAAMFRQDAVASQRIVQAAMWR